MVHLANLVKMVFLDVPETMDEMATQELRETLETQETLVLQAALELLEAKGREDLLVVQVVMVDPGAQV